MHSNPLLPLLARIKLRHLALVVALEETLSLHRAAESLNLSQPAATKLLHEIEEALGAPLFERHARGVIPTPYGIVTGRHARLLLLDLTKLHENIEGLRLGIQGTVRLGSVVAAITELVPEAIAVISREQPTLSISLVTDNSDALLAMLENGRLDVMIGRLTGLQHSDNLRIEPLAGEDLRLIVRTGHPLAARPDVTLPELANERWVLQPEASAMRRAIGAVFTLLQLPAPQHPVETSSMLATINILARTELIAVVPSSVAAYFAALGAIRELPIKLPSLEPYGVITMRERPASPALTYTLATLRLAARKKDLHPLVMVE
jgi:DNA-binding transcriptional LysR family regulator